jgi:hypothetical protein
LRFLALQSKGAGEDAYRELANGITKAVKEGKDLPTNEL